MKFGMFQWLAIIVGLGLVLILTWVVDIKLFRSPEGKPPPREAVRTDAAWELKKLRKLCADKGDRAKSILCFRKSLEDSIASRGFKPFLAALETLFLADDKAQQGGITECHDLAHAIGELGGVNARVLNEALADCTEICTYGCYHGVVEGYVAKHGDFLDELPSLCGGELFAGIRQSSRSACFHGLGHGVASIAGFDIKKSLKLCDVISEEGRSECGSGVIMELYEPSSFAHPLLEFPKDIPEFCKGLGGVYSEACYNTAGLHEYARSLDIKKAFDTCRAVPLTLRRSCQVAIGQNFYFVFQGQAPSIYGACNVASRMEERRVCLEGALISSLVSDPLARHGFELCNIVEEEFRPYCLQFLSRNRR